MNKTQIAILIKRQRQYLGLSQLQLATRANTSHSRISMIESERADPSLDLLLRIAAALDMQLTFIVNREGQPPYCQHQSH